MCKVPVQQECGKDTDQQASEEQIGSGVEEGGGEEEGGRDFRWGVGSR